MNGPKRRNGRDAELSPDNRAAIDAQSDSSTQLAAIGGEPLEGSGFEDEQPEEDFL